MSLRMLHVLAYKCEDGLLLRLCETHNERDDIHAAAEIEWKGIGGEGDAPCFAFDTLVPFSATDHEVKRAISAYLRMRHLKRQLADALAGVLAIDLIKEFIDDLLKSGPPEKEPPHTMH